MLATYMITGILAVMNKHGTDGPLKPQPRDKPAILSKPIIDEDDLKFNILWIVLAIVVGAILRLYNLGGPAFRADTMTFYDVCNSPLRWHEVVSRWFDLQGETSGQFPFTMAFAKCFLDTLHLPPTHFWVRFPFAMAGILSIVAAFFCGQSLGGKRLGLTVALLVAVNPFFIQVATEAYHYSFVILGAFILTWTVLDVAGWAILRQALLRRVYILNTLGFFLMTYSQPSGWGYAFVSGCTILVFAALVSARLKRVVPLLWAAILSYLVIGLPLLVVKWGLPQLRAITTPDHLVYVRRVFGVSTDYFWGVFVSLCKWGWGDRWWGVVLLAVFFLSGLVFVLRQKRSDARGVGLLGLLLFGIIAVYFSTRAAGARPDARYLASYSPAFFLILSCGVIMVSDAMVALAGLKRPCHVMWFVVLTSIVAIQLQPAWWCTQLSGKPIPYKDIQNWFNTHLPKGTLVLVDRWFEPWCELRTYNSTNVVFTFTIPTEPPDVLVKSNWRQTVYDFARKYPDVAYLEVMGSYRQHLGPWDWMDQYFKHKVVLRNEAGSKLFSRGLQLRGEGATRNAVQIYYNNRQDVLDAAKAGGEKILLLYGEGWGYTKLWRQMPGDFRDWRVLQGEGKLDLMNLQDSAVDATLTLRAVALNGSKRICTINGVEHRFPQGKIEDWVLPPLRLKAGANQFAISESGGNAGNTVFLVEDIKISIAAVK